MKQPYGLSSLSPLTYSSETSVPILSLKGSNYQDSINVFRTLIRYSAHLFVMGYSVCIRLFLDSLPLKEILIICLKRAFWAFVWCFTPQSLLTHACMEHHCSERFALNITATHQSAATPQPSLANKCLTSSLKQEGRLSYKT